MVKHSKPIVFGVMVITLCMLPLATSAYATTPFSMNWVDGFPIKNHIFTSTGTGILGGNGQICGLGIVGKTVTLTGIPLYKAPFNHATVIKTSSGVGWWCIAFPNAVVGHTYNIIAHESDGKTDTLSLRIV